MFAYAIQHGYHPGPNPALSQSINAGLPKAEQVRKTKHHEGVPYKKMFQFLRDLDECHHRGPLQCYEGTPPIVLCLKWVAYSGCRPGEATQAQWNEIDEENGIWTVPNDHLKMGRVHGEDKRVPISEEMQALLEEAKEIAYPSESSKWQDRHKQRGVIFPRARHAPDCSPDALIFPNSVNEPFAEGRLARFMRDEMPAYRPAVPHGFRSTLQDWITGETDFPLKLWEIQADHRGDKFKRSYGHDDHLERRRSMMKQYCRYISQPRPEPKPGEVVKLKDKRRTA